MLPNKIDVLPLNSSLSVRLGVALYIHIPFCKQACFYCDFHFSTSLKNKGELISCLAKEIVIRKDELKNADITTIYFGGGTPSLLSQQEIDFLIDTVYRHHKVVKNPEITLEANPDDLSEAKIIELSKSGINRLSIGVQSFFKEDLELMNRAHNAEEAMASLALAIRYFDNISVDLIYGIPDLSDEKWKQNIKTVLDFGIPHISSYALTVEPKTALATLIKKGLLQNVDEEQAQRQFYMLITELKKANFIHYETSNFGKIGFFSENNSAYWQGKHYLGIGPSAHSFDGKKRSWNVKSNAKYIKALKENSLPIEYEILSKQDRYNEYIMTSLRTIWGVSLAKIEKDFGYQYVTYLKKQLEKYLIQELLYLQGGILRTTEKGKFLADGIAADLFKIN